MPPAVYEVQEISCAAEVNRQDLAELLVDSVADGASVGFLAPLNPLAALAYWEQTLAQLGDGRRLWVCQQQGAVVGAVQMLPCLKQNGRHRAEVEKLLVDQKWRRRGIALALVRAVENAAIHCAIRLLVLDTLSHSDAAHFYRKAGWIEAGSVPDYALAPDGKAFSSTFFYRTLTSI